MNVRYENPVEVVPGAGLPSMRILVLDDEPFMRKLLGRMLANLGHKLVQSCDSGEAALQVLADPAGPPDLILLDINMPGMDGVEFVRHLVDRRFHGSLILVGGEDERFLQSVENLVRAHRITVLGHLHKPVSAEGLASLIEKWAPPLRQTARVAKKVYPADELGAAITAGQLMNYYQPKVAVATGELVGMESLVRWRHPTDGMVYPDQFIGVAEHNGLIDALTQEVLRNAMLQARLWRDKGLSLHVAVNLSMDNLSSLQFLDSVTELTAIAGMAPEEMVLEVTESRLLADQRVPLEILTRLRLKRFRLSIDDFGTGNSSLTQLGDIPFQELKIDQSFVHGAWANKTQRAMFDASLGLAKQLGMESVAEGVEDRADWDFLRERGCDLAQGYFIARPMPPENLASWLATWEVRRPGLMVR